MGAKVLFILFMFLALCSAFPGKKKQYTPCKQLVLYFHDIIYNGVNAGNATSAIVAAPEGANLTKLAEHEGTITFAGADPILQKSRDISVTGGTGDFFMHRGIATIMTDAFEGDVYFRLRVDIKFYECW
ncbi:disease resistance response protein 206-like isoform X2 [Gastrolobium bilobum]|uniref:disease resistance response protein 206-like isoform X2 n=1 Tax=Gastrolobium bilobum TaxID=150636 RepID=UPI002AB28750|nr:disease resistance response protein 206-like isoform X2 [Gastrolobium bilobum]